MKFFLSIALLLCHISSVNAQILDSMEWTKHGELNIGKNEIWSVDGLGNVYTTKNKVINKYDSTGILKFSQSIKSFGRIIEIQAINTMKLVTFSEEQQMICLLDNTLTLSEECFDLSNYAISYASHVAVSSQPDKIWVVDQLNSKLLLLSLGNTNQFQEIKNLQGILNVSEVLSIQEVNNELFLIDSNNKIYQFDLYGSLIGMYDFHDFSSMIVNESSLILLTKDHLIIHNILTLEEEKIDLPTIGVQEIKLSGKFFYFRTENKILKYSLSLRN